MENNNSEKLAEQLSEQLLSLKMGDINIPNLYQTPYIICPTVLGNQQYFLEYFWNNRENKVYLSIYKIVNYTKQYYLKNVRLIPNIFLNNYIRNTDWEGFLHFTNIDGNNDISYTIKDISEKFKLVYGYSG